MSEIGTGLMGTASLFPVIPTAAAGLAAGLTVGIPLKKLNKNSYCKNFDLNEHLKYLMMIGITWEHWSEPFKKKDDDVEEEGDEDDEWLEDKSALFKMELEAEEDVEEEGDDEDDTSIEPEVGKIRG